MLNKIQVNNPLLRYRLDPGEPGIPYPSKASMSVARVAGHEVGNIMRFRRKAAREGGIVVDTKIYINRKQVGPYLAATSGYSEARIIYPERRETASGINETFESDLDINSQIKLIESLSEKSISLESPDNKTDNLINNENLDFKIKELEQKERLLSSDLMSALENNNSYKKSAGEFIKQQEIRKVRQELAYLEFQKITEKQKNLLSEYSSQLSASYKLITAQYNLNHSCGSFIDLVV
jgi:hypothetical protein